MELISQHNFLINIFLVENIILNMTNLCMGNK